MIFQRSEHRRPAVLAAALSVVLAVTACSGSGSGDASESNSEIFTDAAPGGTPKSGGKLVFSRSVEPVTFDPIGVTETGSMYAGPQVFDQLVEYFPGKTDPQPALAKSWKSSADGLTYTFKLREGVKFSDGTEVTAEDVRYSLNRLSSKASGGQFISQHFTEIRAIDSLTVEIELSKPNGALIHYLGIGYASIIPKHVMEEVGAKRFGEAPIGSGPFVVAEWKRGQSLTLARNPHYWRKGKPYLDSVEFKLTPDANTRVLDVQSGGADVADALPFSQLAPLRKDARTRLVVRRLNATAMMLFNNTDSNLKDAKVRRALSSAIPRDQIVKNVYAAAGEPATSLLPKMTYWDKSSKGWVYDIPASKKLLKSSDKPSGFRTSILLQAGDPDSKAVAQVIQGAWAELGIEARIRQVDSATFYSQWSAGDYETMLFPADAASSDVPVEDETASFLLDYTAGANSAFSFYNSSEATRLVQSANASVSDGERRKLFGELQALTIKDSPMTGIAYVPSRHLLSKRVRGFDALPSGWWRLDETWLGN